MSAASVNRETYRDGLAALLATALVGTGKPVDKSYGYLVGDFGKPLSAVIVTSTGTERTQNPSDQTFDVWVYLDIWTFVIQKDTNWTEAQAEDKRDLIEKTVADVVQDNTSSAGLWDDLQFAGRTTATDVQFEGGAAYFIEQIPVKCHVFQG